ncbi:MAG: acyl-CoA ligase (AMP-forming), exosortase A system-associated [Gammaproteobacteria bacterium]|nr:acyl-CoA ligase (AMP-forming), exosortase A system-associated [Gammaproteobacteria bacterium]
MAYLLHHTLLETAARTPARTLLVHDKHGAVDAAGCASEALALAGALATLGLGIDDRVAVFLPKDPVCAFAFYAVSAAGGVFVPVNPVLKPAQVAHILNDCDVRVLLTSPDRARHLESALGTCPALRHVILSEPPPPDFSCPVPHSVWQPAEGHADFAPPRRTDNDMAAILYTSGSTGRPKGVIISHRNIVDGARSVSSYLEIGPHDRLLAVLPFSFDYGLNQLTSAVLCGATCVLFDYLLPRDVIRALERHAITGLAAVPPLWAQLAPLEWPAAVAATLRYITNSGGAMPDGVLARLRAKLPRTRPFLMYGLTEAFRSTFLSPDDIDQRRGSMGKAIPNAEIMVVRADGTPAAPNEPGELVHRGALVALGYWNDPERTAQRFRPAPGRPHGIPVAELAVWSGDTVRRDEDGYLYFVGRNDGMIKTSGYRVSPEEIEEVLYASGRLETVAAIGVPHPALGQAVVVVATALPGEAPSTDDIVTTCRAALPGYMVPARVFITTDIPRNPNGKIDRGALVERHKHLFDSLETAP